MLQEAIVVEDPAMIWTDDTCDEINDDRVLSRLLAKVDHLKAAGKSMKHEQRRVMERFEMLVNRSEADAMAVADVAVSL